MTILEAILIAVMSSTVAGVIAFCRIQHRRCRRASLAAYDAWPSPRSPSAPPARL
ncbi:hypothetical protein [Methylogaea oryzae]|uniref:hypothetical protein n=1 Tax=Methylogaea oryzae TaxID=1295382 RepID=UPI001C7F50CA|nr:hypothetical protein [Methylogaea oryzae]